MNNLDLGDVAVFVRVVEAGGFSAAARTMQAPKSSVSRRVARLEAKLGVRLLYRTTRSLALTEVGRAYYARVSVALAEMTEAAGEAVHAQEVPRGTVRVVAPLDVGAEVLPQIVTHFVARYPEVRVDVTLTADAANLVEEGYDLALRGGHQPDSQLGMRKLHDTAFRLYASPEYLARAGVPSQVEDLAGHACVLFHARDGKRRWRFYGPEGEVSIEVRGAITANGLSFTRRAAIAGAGIALLPDVVGRPAVAQGQLQNVLPEYHAQSNALYIVYPSIKHLPLKVRAFRDFLLESFPR